MWYNVTDLECQMIWYNGAVMWYNVAVMWYNVADLECDLV